MTPINYISITYSDVNNILPEDYTEKIYLYKNRVRKTGHFYSEFKTSEREKTVFDDFYKEHIVQAIVFDRYKFEFIKTENYDIETMRYAQTIQFYDVGTRIYFTPQIISIETTKVKGFDVVAVEFYDINTENYPQGTPIVNNFRNDVIKVKYTGWQFNTLVRLSIDADRYYGMIPLTEIEGDIEDTQELVISGQKYNVRSTTRTKQQAIFYLNDADLQALKESIGVSAVTLYYDSVTHTALEVPEIEVTQIPGSVELHKVVISITTDINIDYQYRSDEAISDWEARINLRILSADHYFYTKIPVVVIESEQENVQESELNGKIIQTRNTTKTKQEVTLFLSDSDLQLFSYYAAQCGEESTIFLEYGSYSDSNEERGEIEVTRQSNFNTVIFRFADTINNNLIYA